MEQLAGLDPPSAGGTGGQIRLKIFPTHSGTLLLTIRQLSGAVIFFFLIFIITSGSQNQKNMKHKIFFLVILIFGVINMYGQRNVKLKTESDSVSYAIGVSMHSGASQFPLELDFDKVAAGLKAAAEGKAVMEIEDAHEYLTKVSQAEQEKAVKRNREEGIAFLAENKKRKEVVVTQSGLQYEVVRKGDGPVPTANDQVKVDYTGYLIDGTIFDSSVERGEPAVFGVTQVIAGWTEVLQLMPAGSEYKVFIPSDLAYGERQMGGDIQPGSTLIFDIHLLEVVE
jgi:FKBP-type peptidyl-prolyl cis-trans isomerase